MENISQKPQISGKYFTKHIVWLFLMEKNSQIHLQEIIFGSSDSSISMQLSRLEKDGKIRKIATRLYSGNLEDSPETIVRRN